MKTLLERFNGCNLSSDNITARIEGFTRSTGIKGTWYTFIAMVLTRENIYEEFVCKLNAGVKNEEHIKATDDFFNNFKAGDYNITNVQVRIAGQQWTDEDNELSGTYKTSYLSVPTYSDLMFKGSDATLDMRKREREFAKLALESMEVE